MQVGSIHGKRTMRALGTSRRCHCGEGATHTGFGDGVALTIGCTLCIRRWVRDGAKAQTRSNRVRGQVVSIMANQEREQWKRAVKGETAGHDRLLE